MSAESHEIWIKKESLENYDLEGGWIDEIGIRESEGICDEFPFAHFENVESEALEIAKSIGLPFLKDGEKDKDADYVFVLDKGNITGVIGKCQELIHESIMFYNDDDYAKSETKRVLNYVDEGWDDEIPRTLCILLERLKNVKRVLDKYPGRVLVVEVAW